MPLRRGEDGCNQTTEITPSRPSSGRTARRSILKSPPASASTSSEDMSSTPLSRRLFRHASSASSGPSRSWFWQSKPNAPPSDESVYTTPPESKGRRPPLVDLDALRFGAPSPETRGTSSNLRRPSPPPQSSVTSTTSASSPWYSSVVPSFLRSRRLMQPTVETESDHRSRYLPPGVRPLPVTNTRTGTSTGSRPISRRQATYGIYDPQPRSGTGQNMFASGEYDRSYAFGGNDNNTETDLESGGPVDVNGRPYIQNATPVDSTPSSPVIPGGFSSTASRSVAPPPRNAPGQPYYKSPASAPGTGSSFSSTLGSAAWGLGSGLGRGLKSVGSYALNRVTGFGAASSTSQATTPVTSQTQSTANAGSSIDLEGGIGSRLPPRRPAPLGSTGSRRYSLPPRYGLPPLSAPAMQSSVASPYAPSVQQWTQGRHYHVHAQPLSGIHTHYHASSAADSHYPAQSNPYTHAHYHPQGQGPASASSIGTHSNWGNLRDYISRGEVSSDRITGGSVVRWGPDGRVKQSVYDRTGTGDIQYTRNLWEPNGSVYSASINARPSRW